MQDIPKQVKKLKYMRLLAIPIAALMFFCTMNFVGANFAIVLGAIAGAAFFFILERGRTSVVGEALIEQVRVGIDEVRHIENIVELKKMPEGMLVRVYLIQGDGRTDNYESAIRKNFYLNNLESFVWKIQITNLGDVDEFDERRKLLDEDIINNLDNEEED